MIQGVYINDVGVAFMVANPTGNPVIDDVSFVLSPNISLAESFQNASDAAYESFGIICSVLCLHSLVNSNSSLEELCFMTILFQMDPVPVDWNSKYEGSAYSFLANSFRLLQQLLSLSNL